LCYEASRFICVFMTPDTDYPPAFGLELPVGVGIAGAIGFDLGPPPRSIRLRPGPMCRAAVPEAAIDKNRHTGQTEDNVCATSDADQRGCIDGIAEAEAMESRPET
jgi:hypothetical protein